MNTLSLNTLLAVALFTTLSSCRSESPHTTETAQATMSYSQSDRVYYIERAADKFAGDLILHLQFNDEAQQMPKPIYVNNSEPNIDPSPTHIGPFRINKTRAVKKEAWDLEKIILEWIFDREE